MSTSASTSSDSTHNSAQPPAPPPLKIGPWELVPGVKRAHFNALLGASFFTIGLMTLVGNLQPYLFNAVLEVPIGEQGKLSGSLASFNEILFLMTASFIGAASDKVGRRPLYALGFVIMASAYVLYPLATEASQLFLFRGIFAIGAACVSSMLAAIIADYAMESSRGRLVGICFFLNGIGVATLVVFGGRLPKIIEAMGAEPVMAARCAYWTVAALCFLPFLIVAFGLQAGAPARIEKKDPLLTTLRIGLEAAREPRILLAYFSAMVSRGDLAVLSTFFLLWITTYGIGQGLSPAEAQAAGTKFFGLAQIMATLWALVVIAFIDKLDRTLALALAMILASASYLIIGSIDDPLGSGMYLAAAFMGIGEMSAILASQSLIGQVAGDRGRGAIIGVFSMFGAAGILMASFVGGILFDAWKPSAPYLLVGAADGVLAMFALVVYFKSRSQ
ncbi:MAG: MFS transporter [Gammaproteobacteria bacterium]|jgi:MFS family permease|nr:MFS transporter [Gammaproteobacteria bacterium]NDA43977.1 MFS transporter [Gammaproteobacteria bacterium]